MGKIGYIFLLFVAFLSFSGCTLTDMTKVPKASQSNETQYATVEDNGEYDDMLDEFEDEISVEEVYDPLSGYNRIMTGFNDIVYMNVLIPISRGYANIFNDNIRLSVRRFFNNLYFPARFTNNFLQGKFKNATEEGGRFVINTTIGLLGFFDPAKNEFGLEEHDEDFGQTLGFYGVGSGPHIVLPLLGPSNLRDAFGMIPDSYLSLIDYEERSYWTLSDTWPEYIAAKSYEEINNLSLTCNRYEKFKEDAVDLYPYLRDVYEQYRNKQIKE